MQIEENSGSQEGNEEVQQEQNTGSPSNLGTETVLQRSALPRMALLQEAFEKALEYGLKDPSRRVRLGVCEPVRPCLQTYYRLAVQEFGDFYPELDDTLVDALYDTYQQTLVLVRSHCQVGLGEGRLGTC